jgi:opacity protein-like surface antigen
MGAMFLQLIRHHLLILTAALACLCALPSLVFAQTTTTDATRRDSTYISGDAATEQSTTESDTSKVPRVFRHTFFFTMSFGEDTSQGGSAFLGGAYRFIAAPAWDLGLLLAFSARGDEAYTLEQIRPRFYLQLKEKYRFLVSLSADKVFMMKGWFGAYAGAGVGYSWGEYEGTERDPESKWTPVVDVGLTGRFGMDSGRFVVRIGYQYADRATSEPDTGYIALGIGI